VEQQDLVKTDAGTIIAPAKPAYQHGRDGRATDGIEGAGVAVSLMTPSTRLKLRNSPRGLNSLSPTKTSLWRAQKFPAPTAQGICLKPLQQ
jgi:hypothetical protein